MGRWTIVGGGGEVGGRSRQWQTGDIGPTILQLSGDKQHLRAIVAFPSARWHMLSIDEQSTWFYKCKVRVYWTPREDAIIVGCSEYLGLESGECAVSFTIDDGHGDSKQTHEAIGSILHTSGLSLGCP